MVDPSNPDGKIPPELEELLVDGSQQVTMEEMEELLRQQADGSTAEATASDKEPNRNEE